MSNVNTLELNEAIKSAETQAMIDPTFFTSLARQLQLAISSNGESIPELEVNLGRLLKATLAQIPPDVIDDLDGDDLTATSISIFNAGQLSFAHQVVSEAATKIGDDTLASIVNEQKYRPYLIELAQNSLSGVELSKKCNQRPETVSRNIGELRELGLVEYRRQGTAFVNFLTPIGRALLQLNSENKNKSDIYSSGYNALINATAPPYRTFPIFGLEIDMAA